MCPASERPELLIEIIQTPKRSRDGLSQSCTGHLQVKCYHGGSQESFSPAVLLSCVAKQTHSPHLLVCCQQGFHQGFICSLTRWIAAGTPTKPVRRAKWSCSVTKTSALSVAPTGSPTTMNASSVPGTCEYWAQGPGLAAPGTALLDSRTSTKASSVGCLDFDPPLFLLTKPCFPLWLEGKPCLWSRQRRRGLGGDLTQDRMLLLTKLKGSVQVADATLQREHWHCHTACLLIHPDPCPSHLAIKQLLAGSDPSSAGPWRHNLSWGCLLYPIHCAWGYSAFLGDGQNRLLVKFPNAGLFPFPERLEPVLARRLMVNVRRKLSQ